MKNLTRATIVSITLSQHPVFNLLESIFFRFVQQHDLLIDFVLILAFFFCREELVFWQVVKEPMLMLQGHGQSWDC